MIQSGTRLKVCDNTGAKVAECFKVLGSSRARFAKVGDVIVVSIKDASPTASVAEHEIAYAVIVRQRKEMRRADGSYIRFDDNAVVILNDRKSTDIKGTRILGPVAREIVTKGYKKIASLAPEVW